LHIFGAIGLWGFFLGFLSLSFSIYARIFQGLSLNRNGWFFMGFFLILTGVMFFSLGIIIDLLIRIQQSTSQYAKRYYIREILETR